MTTIYHNPDCSTSRRVLTMLRARSIEPAIIEYLHDPPDEQTLASLFAAIGIAPRAALRRSEAAYAMLGLADQSLSDAALIRAMHAYPVLIQRPIVETPMGVRICRPTERLLEILPRDNLSSDTAHA